LFHGAGRPGFANHGGRILFSPAALVRCAVLFWVVLIAIVASVSAIAITSTDSIWALVPGNPVTLQVERLGFAINVGLVILACAISIAVGFRAPYWWRRVLFLSMIIPMLAMSLLSGRLIALVVLCTMLGPASALGQAVATAIVPRHERLASWVIGIPLGLGLIGFAGFVLGSVGLLRAYVIWPLLCVLIILLARVRYSRLSSDAHAISEWFARPIQPRMGLLVFSGIMLSFTWIYFIGALTPETATDATWQRLAAAAQFAQRGDLVPDYPELTVSRHPAFGEMLYAVGLTIGPLSTAKLLHFSIGVCCALAVYIIGHRLASPDAAKLGSLMFYTLPLVGWLSQIAFLDLFLALFALAAMVSIIYRQSFGFSHTIAVGIFVALGVVVKLHFAYVGIGLILMLGLFIFVERGIRDAFVAVTGAAMVALLVCLPFLLRSAILLGELPGLALGTQALQRSGSEQPAIMGDLSGFGSGRSFLNLVSLPLDVTLRSYRFEINPTPSGPFGGMVAYLLLASLPLLICIRPRRMLVVSLSGIGVALLLWFFTAQYLRYALAIIALFCPLGGAAFVATNQTITTRFGQVIFRAAFVVLVCAGLLIQLRLPPLGWKFALGQENETTYLTKYLVCCSGYTVLDLLAQEPHATRVLASAGTARLYAHVRISTVLLDAVDLDLRGDEGTLLARLEAAQFSHIIVARQGQGAVQTQATVFNQDFLRRHTLLVGGDARGYLYRIVYANQQERSDWTRGEELLAFLWSDNALQGEMPRNTQSPGPSSLPRADVLGVDEQGKRTSVTVTPRNRYLFSYTVQAMVAEDSKVHVTIEWRDERGELLDAAVQIGQTDPTNLYKDVMVVTAPERAISAMITVQAEHGSVLLRDFSFRLIAGPPAGIQGACDDVAHG